MNDLPISRGQLVRLAVVAAALLAITVALVGLTPGLPAPDVGGHDAVAEVVIAHPELAGIQPRDPRAVGQADYWTARKNARGWTVVFRRGWGDCAAGCMHEHVWEFRVIEGSAPLLVGERGDELPD